MPIFLLGDSVPMFKNTLWDAITGSEMRCSSTNVHSGQTEERIWWDVVVGSATRDWCAAHPGKPAVGCYLGASNGDLDEYYSMFELAAKRINLSPRHVKATSNSDADRRCVAEEAALILLAGGDPLVGLSAFKASALDASICLAHSRDAVLVGISAGAMQIGSHVYNPGDEGVPQRALGLVPLFIGAHEEEEDWKSSRAALSAVLRANAPADDVEFLGLGLPYQSGVTVHEDGSLTPIGQAGCPVLGSSCAGLTPYGSGSGNGQMPCLTLDPPGRWCLRHAAGDAGCRVVEVVPWRPHGS